MIFAVLDVSLAVNLCINCSFFTFFHVWTTLLLIEIKFTYVIYRVTATYRYHWPYLKARYLRNSWASCTQYHRDEYFSHEKRECSDESDDRLTDGFRTRNTRDTRCFKTTSVAASAATTQWDHCEVIWSNGNLRLSHKVSCFVLTLENELYDWFLHRAKIYRHRSWVLSIWLCHVFVRQPSFKYMYSLRSTACIQLVVPPVKLLLMVDVYFVCPDELFKTASVKSWIHYRHITVFCFI